jgi:hypothetical protein
VTGDSRDNCQLRCGSPRVSSNDAPLLLLLGDTEKCSGSFEKFWCEPIRGCSLNKGPQTFRDFTHQRHGMPMRTRQGQWAIVDLVGKGGHIRTVPMPQGAKDALDSWTSAAGIAKGRLFRAIGRAGKVWRVRRGRLPAAVYDHFGARSSGATAGAASTAAAKIRAEKKAARTRRLDQTLGCPSLGPQSGLAPDRASSARTLQRTWGTRPEIKPHPRVRWR